MQHELANAPNRLDSAMLRIWAVIMTGLLVLSWKLWILAGTDYPRVPLLDFNRPLLGYLQYFASTALILGLALTAISPQKITIAGALIAAGFGISFLCNQHCLQPWAWQAFIIATLLLCLPTPDAKKWIAWLMISIYLYSAIGKFDYQFVNSLGRQFLGVIYQWLGLTLNRDDVIAPWLVLTFPLGEFLIGVGLSYRKTRRLAAFLAISLHLTLIAILSPLGLGHRWPVLIWNGMTIVLVCWLFLGTDLSTQKRSHQQHRKPMSEHLGIAFAFVVLLGPLLRPLQLWDHWLAWGLYSPSNSRVELFLPELARENLRSEQLQQYLIDNRILGRNRTGILKFALDRYTLDELGVPIYPQARFQKAVAIEFLQQQGLTDFCQLEELGPSDPRTGKRSRKQINLSKESWRATTD